LVQRNPHCAAAHRGGAGSRQTFLKPPRLSPIFMSDDADRPRKTLTLTRPSRSAQDENPRRKRSGARAKNAEQLESGKEKTGRMPQAGGLRNDSASPAAALADRNRDE